MLVFSGFAAVGADNINVALPCGKIGVARGLGAGTDVTRYTIDMARTPNAVCNDGTPGVFYYAPATRAADQGKWLIFLQGGGTCSSGQGCAERWCSFDSNYGMDKISSGNNVSRGDDAAPVPVVRASLPRPRLPSLDSRSSGMTQSVIHCRLPTATPAGSRNRR